MKSKEEILIEAEDKWMKDNGYPDTKGIKEIALLAMQEYADQVKPKWISDKLPNETGCYLVFYKDYNIYAIQKFYSDEKGAGEWGNVMNHSISAWMPLPESPKL